VLHKLREICSEANKERSDNNLIRLKVHSEKKW